MAKQKYLKNMMIFNEKINKPVVQSAGLVIIQNNKILLVHPAGAQFWHSYSFPKGHVEFNETILEAAIRETKEETGIDVSIDDIDVNNMYVIDMKDKNGNLYKKVFYFIAKPEDDIVINKDMIQIEEIDYCEFFNKTNAEKRISPKFIEILNFLN